MSTEKTKTIVLVSSDDEAFEIETSVVEESQTIKNLIDDGCADKPIPLPNVTSKILVKVIEYLKHHSSSEEEGKDGSDKKKPSKPIEEKKAVTGKKKKASKSKGEEGEGKPKLWEEFDSKFAKVDNNTLFELACAANYLNINPMLDVVMQTFADKMKGKSPQYVRDLFHIKNDFTPAEEEEVHRENLWAFE
ncbi:OLC1v1006467C1 [Oldenlandia corymbosa var. corymbosa]|uniref:SKP1-like protein n=1 Tax=Oldenlandia corymbosa var. corymbosa TaxID=529605 RepID=A0AAV1DJQ2_OLDCO|nr:OLC1v1006467C1 [Oldenlandia corymbosa var. corymbosa]